MTDHPSSKIYTYCFGFVLGLMTLLLSLFFMLPTIASSSWGKNKIENYASARFDGSISFDNLNFSFWGSQEVKGLEIKDDNGDTIVTLGKATFQTSFPELLFQSIMEGPILFHDLNMTVVELPDGTTNIQKALKIESVKSEKPINNAPTSPILLKNVHGAFALNSSSQPLVLKLEGLSSLNSVVGLFDLDISLNGVDLDQLMELKNQPEMLFVDSTSFKVNINAKNFPIALLDNLLAMKTSKYKPHLLVSTFGDMLDLTLNKVKIDQGKSLTLELMAKAPNLNANFVGEVALDKIFTTKPSTLMFALNQELLEYFYPEESGFTLENPANVLVAIEEFDLPLNLKDQECDLLNLMFKGRIDLAEAKLTSKTSLPDIILQKFSAHVRADKNSDDLILKIEGDALQHDQPIKIALETVLHKSLNFRKHKLPPLMIDLKHIPVAMIDHFFGMDKSLSNTIGTHADLKIEALVCKEHLDLILKFDSEKLSIPSFKMKINDDLSMIEAPVLNYTLDETTAKQLIPENSFFSIDTAEPLSISFHVDPIKNIYEIIDPLNEKFSGTLTITQVLLNVKQAKHSLSFQEIIIPWEIDAETKELKVSFEGKTKYSHETLKGSFSGLALFQKEQMSHLFDVTMKQKNSSGHESKLDFKGNIENLLTEEGALNINGMGLTLDATVADLPTPLFCKVACLDKSLHQKIEVLFGDFLSASVGVRLKSLNGVVQANVNGQEGSFTLDSKIHEGFLFLNQPFQAKFTVTSRLGESILQDVFPILSGVVSSDQPILIAIASEGFVFPLKKLDVAQIEIPQAILSLGHVKFDKSGELATVLSLLTPPDTDLISVWFTPLYFNMHEGVLKLERVDLLISNLFPVASWGKIDLIQDKVKMTIGMSGYALTHAFKIKGLDNEYMIQIPYTGTTTSAKIDKVNATTKIGALIAQGQGGPKGLVLGTVLSIAGGALTEEKPPKSTTIPLPWTEELRLSHATSAEPSGNEKPTPPKEPEIDHVAQAENKVKKKKQKGFHIDKNIEENAEMFIRGFFN